MYDGGNLGIYPRELQETIDSPLGKIFSFLDMHIVIEHQPVCESFHTGLAQRSGLIVLDKPDLTTALPAKLCKIK